MFPHLTFQRGGTSPEGEQRLSYVSAQAVPEGGSTEAPPPIETTASEVKIDTVDDGEAQTAAVQETQTTLSAALPGPDQTVTMTAEPGGSIRVEQTQGDADAQAEAPKPAPEGTATLTAQETPTEGDSDEEQETNTEATEQQDKGTHSAKLTEQMNAGLRDLEKAKTAGESLAAIAKILSAIVEMIKRALDGTLMDKAEEKKEKDGSAAAQGTEAPAGNKDVQADLEARGAKTLEQRAQALPEIKQEATEKIDANTTEIGKIDAEVDRLQTEKKPIDDKIGALEGQIIDARQKGEDVTTLKTTLEGLKKQAQALQTTIEEHLSRRETLVAENKQLEEKVKSAERMEQSIDFTIAKLGEVEKKLEGLIHGEVKIVIDNGETQVVVSDLTEETPTWVKEFLTEHDADSDAGNGSYTLDTKNAEWLSAKPEGGHEHTVHGPKEEAGEGEFGGDSGGGADFDASAAESPKETVESVVDASVSDETLQDLAYQDLQITDIPRDQVTFAFGEGRRSVEVTHASSGAPLGTVEFGADGEVSAVERNDQTIHDAQASAPDQPTEATTETESTAAEAAPADQPEPASEKPAEETPEGATEPAEEAVIEASPKVQALIDRARQAVNTIEDKVGQGQPVTVEDLRAMHDVLGDVREQFDGQQAVVDVERALGSLMGSGGIEISGPDGKKFRLLAHTDVPGVPRFMLIDEEGNAVVKDDGEAAEQPASEKPAEETPEEPAEPATETPAEEPNPRGPEFEAAIRQARAYQPASEQPAPEAASEPNPRGPDFEAAVKQASEASQEVSVEQPASAEPRAKGDVEQPAPAVAEAAPAAKEKGPDVLGEWASRIERRAAELKYDNVKVSVQEDGRMLIVGNKAEEIQKLIGLASARMMYPEQTARTSFTVDIGRYDRGKGYFGSQATEDFVADFEEQPAAAAGDGFRVTEETPTPEGAAS